VTVAESDALVEPMAMIPMFAMFLGTEWRVDARGDV
jgi:hypothetical protein